MHPLSKQTQLDVISQLQNGKSIRKIANNLGISKSAVQKIRANQLSDLPKSNGGRPAKLSSQAKRYCVKKITTGNLNTAVAVTNALNKDFQYNASVSTVKRALHEAGLSTHKKLKKPRLSSKNIKDRLSFAKSHQHWTIEDWRRVIFSDETKINRFGSDGYHWTWTHNGELLRGYHINQTVKYGGGSIMIWGCITAKGPGIICKIDSILNQHLYCSILEDKLMQTLERYELNLSDIIFQQDNDPKHTAKSVQKWFNDKGLEVLSWPSQSPDINPIEHLWAKIKQGLNEYDTPPNGIIELWKRVQEVWNKITLDNCLNLIDSMPRRIQAIIRAKGKWTKY